MLRNCIIVFLLVIFGSPTVLPAQTERSLEPFDEINITGNINVTLVPGDAESIELEVRNIPENKVTVKVSGGVLRLKVLESMFYKDEEIRATVTYRRLRAIRADAGATVESPETVTGDELLLRAGSGSRADLEVEVNSIDAGASEGGVLRLIGKTEKQEASASTGGQYMALHLDAQQSYIKASTGGQAEVVAHQFLEANANTGGIISYKGEPGNTSLKTVLSGEVRKI